MRIALSGRGRLEEPEWIVILTVAVALAIGLLVRTSVVSRTNSVAVANMSISYPASWGQVSEQGAAFAAADLSGGVGATRASVWQIPKEQLVTTKAKDVSLTEVATAWSLKRANELASYRVLSVEPIKVQGRDAVNVKYAYVAEGRQGAAGRVLPRVMQGIDTLVAGGDQFYILTFAAESSEFGRLDDLHQSLLSSWRLP